MLGETELNNPSDIQEGSSKVESENERPMTFFEFKVYVLTVIGMNTFSGILAVFAMVKDPI